MAKIVRYNPWNEMATLNRFMGRWLDDAIGGNGSRGDGDWNMDVPAIDIKETPESYEVMAELPGWKPDDIDVTIEKGVLTLKGELHTDTAEQPAQSSTDKWHSREIRR